MLSPRLNFFLRAGNSSGTGFCCFGDDSVAALRPRPLSDRLRTCRSACLAPYGGFRRSCPERPIVRPCGGFRAWLRVLAEPEPVEHEARVPVQVPARRPRLADAEPSLSSRKAGQPVPASLGADRTAGKGVRPAGNGPGSRCVRERDNLIPAETAFPVGEVPAKHLETSVSDIRCDAESWQFGLPLCGGDIGPAGRSRGSPNTGRACASAT